MSNRNLPKVRRIKNWCPKCDSAILSGTICYNCNTDIGNPKDKGKVKVRPKRIKQEEEDDES